jgi:hypothetical protein
MHFINISFSELYWMLMVINYNTTVIQHNTAYRLSEKRFGIILTYDRKKKKNSIYLVSIIWLMNCMPLSTWTELMVMRNK